MPSDDVRCVWMTRQQRDALGIMLNIAESCEQGRDSTTANTAWEPVDAWDAAPADPAEAAKAANHEVLEGYVSACHSDESAEAVLRALGMDA